MVVLHHLRPKRDVGALEGGTPPCVLLPCSALASGGVAANGSGQLRSFRVAHSCGLVGRCGFLRCEPTAAYAKRLSP